MIGPHHFYNVIGMKYQPAGNNEYGWSANIKFMDSGFLNDSIENKEISTEGTLRTRYFVRNQDGKSGARAALEAILADAKRFGIEQIPKSKDWHYPTALFIDGNEEALSIIPDSEYDIINQLAEEYGYEVVTDSDE